MSENLTNERIANPDTPRFGKELGRAFYNSARAIVVDRFSMLPYCTQLEDPKSHDTFMAALGDGVREVVKFDLVERGISGAELYEKTAQIADAYLNFLSALNQNGLGIKA